LLKKGAEVQYHDPFIPEIHHETEGWKMKSIPNVMAAVPEADAVIIVTNHATYDYPSILKNANFVFDTRNALGKIGGDDKKVVRL
jgi:UDP-N-acetyl-D-glucosamine dehydrogenase